MEEGRGAHRRRLDEIQGRQRSGPRGAPRGVRPPQIVVGDTTIEVLGEIVRHNPAGVLVERDELTGWLAGMTAYTSGKSAGGGSPARSAMLEAWNAGPYDVDRIGRGHIRIPSFGVSVVGGIQDDKVRSHFEGDSDGLLARFLFAEAPQPLDISRDLPDDTSATDAWKAVLSVLANAATSQVVLLSEDAARVRENMERRAKGVIDASDTPESWRAHAGKWQGIFLRLCLSATSLSTRTRCAPNACPVGSGDLAERVVFRMMTEWLAAGGCANPHVGARPGTTIDGPAATSKPSPT